MFVAPASAGKQADRKVLLRKTAVGERGKQIRILSLDSNSVLLYIDGMRFSRIKGFSLGHGLLFVRTVG
jgi:hypothetical protein